MILVVGNVCRDSPRARKSRRFWNPKSMVVSGGALIFARMLSCTFLRFTCFGGVGWVGDVKVR